MKVYKTLATPENDIVLLANKDTDLSSCGLTPLQISYINKHIEKKHKRIEVNCYTHTIHVCMVSQKNEEYTRWEKARLLASEVLEKLNHESVEKVTVVDTIQNKEITLAFVEGLLLRSYNFLKYFEEKKVKKKQNSLNEIAISSNSVSDADVQELVHLTDAVFITRDFANEPPNKLSAAKFAKRMSDWAKEAGFSAEVFDKRKLETLKFGGLLAVNLGSDEPPTFTIMEWKPENPINEKPFVFVGKGVTFDTGGLSLKSTENMLTMKADMSGGAAVAGLMYAVAKNKLNVHVIGLVPATDNRPGGNAYAPTDVIRMHSGLTVEVLNTDAEGRIILADALSYAKKFTPDLVIDIATLTGSASATVGKHATVAMGKVETKIMDELKNAGNLTYERIVELPLWDEYDETLKSNFADLKNLGKEAGAITSAKFLQHFVDYPWIHLDIAGPFYHAAQENYRGNGASGVGVRLLYQFLKNYYVSKIEIN